MLESQNRLVVYTAPKDVVGNNDFKVRVRMPHEEWKELFSYKVKVDMHNVREASMVYFDFEGNVEIEVTKNSGNVDSVEIRPFSFGIKHEIEENKIYFKLDKPRKVSFEVNGDRFNNLHIFANQIEENVPNPESAEVVYVKPGIHRTEDILRKIITPTHTEGISNILNEPKVIYFAPGMHYLEEILLYIPSGKTVYIAGGAVIVGSMVCEKVENVTIRGRGILYFANLERFTAIRGIRIVFSKNINIEGIITVDPPHYSIYLGQSQNITIRNFKTFSTRGWSDGIDCMSCSDMVIDDVFLRTSDDSIVIYGRRWDFNGDSRNIKVMNSVVWADVAHPLMIGTHGDYYNDGNIIENIVFENIDIIEHHEPQLNYLGCMAINAGDKNYVRNVRYENIRVEQFENGRLFDIRVFMNKDYNPAPGKKIENIYFKDITYNGSGEHPSQIMGYDEEKMVDGVTFDNLRINGKHITNSESGNIKVGEFAYNVSYK